MRESGGQSGSPLGPLKKKQKHDKIHWRTDKIKKKKGGFQKGSHFG